MTAPPADDDFSALLGRATAGDAQAQYALGNYYFRGRSLTLEHAEALGWYRKSAEQGYAPAENQLGAMYQHGFGVVRNFKLALAYYRKAADQGYAPAEFNLGVTYESGNYAVKRDYKQAFAWYQKAADQSWPDGEREVAYFCQCGFAVKQDLAQALAGYRELEHTNKGKKDAITKVFNAIGSVPAAKCRLQAENDCDAASRLRDEPRQLESQDQ